MDMGNPRGVARDFDALEARRMNALANRANPGRALHCRIKSGNQWSTLGLSPRRTINRATPAISIPCAIRFLLLS